MKYGPVIAVPITRIDNRDRRFVISLHSSLDSLIQSLKRSGQLYPLLVRKEGERYIVIDGLNRLNAAKELGFTTVYVVEVPEENYSSLKCYLIHLDTINSHRKLNEIEKANVVNALIEDYNISYEELQKVYAPLIDMTVFPRSIEICEKVAKLPEELKQYLVEKNIRLNVLMNYAKMDKKSFYKIIDIAGRLQIGGNKLRQLFVLAHESAFREQKTPADVLNTSEIQGILHNTAMTLQQRWEHLYRYMYRIRYPEWSGINKEIKKEIAKLELPQSVKLICPENLEGDHLNLNITFKTQEELKKHGEKIINIAESGTIQKILKWIK